MQNKVLLFLLLCLISINISQARVRPVSFDELPKKADFIVLGRVVDSLTRMGANGLMVFTDYVILVEEWYKGSGPTEITMSFAGGELGDKSITVSESPSLRVGDEYIIFGYDSEKQYWTPVVGLEQGVFRIVHDDSEGGGLVTDYNGYQIEMNAGGEMVRGSMTALDIYGDLRQIIIEAPEKPKYPPPIVRDADGNVIEQEEAVFHGPSVRASGQPVTLPMFESYVQSIVHSE
jgi:hypothetical protein